MVAVDHSLILCGCDISSFKLFYEITIMNLILLVTLIITQLSTTSSALLRGRKLSLFADSFASVNRLVDNGNEGEEKTMETRIIGGSQASKGRYSYAVSIQDGIGHFCG